MITQNTVKTIHRMKARGMANSQIARELNLHHSVVKAALNGTANIVAPKQEQEASELVNA